MEAVLERSSALAVLNDAVADAAAGHGRVVLVSGEAGIGKTSLLRAFRAERPADVRVLWGACDDLLTARTLGPLRDAAAGTSGPLAEALASGNGGDVVFDAVLAEFDAPSPGPRHRATTVLVVEDLHWADDATLDVLGYLARRLGIGGRQGVLIGTIRDGGAPAGHPLWRWLGALTGPHVRRLPLQPLSQPAVEQLAQGTGWDPAGLHALTGGNPFFVTEVLAAGAGEVPDSVADAVLTRVRTLGDGCQRALAQLAVVPGTVEFGLAETLLAGELELLAEAEEHGILQVSASGVAFRHELARQAIEQGIPLLRRRALHQNVITALRDAPSAPDLARLVHHAAQAGDAETVLEYAVRAGRESARAGSHRQALAHFEAAVQHADRLDPPRQAALLDNYAWELHNAHRFGEALQAGERAVELYSSLAAAPADALHADERTTTHCPSPTADPASAARLPAGKPPATRPARLAAGSTEPCVGEEAAAPYPDLAAGSTAEEAEPQRAGQQAAELGSSLAAGLASAPERGPADALLADQYGMEIYPDVAAASAAVVTEPLRVGAEAGAFRSGQPAGSADVSAESQRAGKRVVADRSERAAGSGAAPGSGPAGALLAGQLAVADRSDRAAGSDAAQDARPADALPAGQLAVAHRSDLAAGSGAAQDARPADALPAGQQTVAPCPDQLAEGPNPAPKTAPAEPLALALGESRVRLSRLYYLAGDTERAEAVARAAVEVVEPAGSSEATAYATVYHAAILALSGDPRADATLRRAAALATTSRRVDLIELCLNYQALAQPRLDPAERIGLLRRSLALALEHGHYEHAARGYTNLGELLYRYGRFAELEQCLADGLAFTRERGFWSHTYNLEVHHNLLRLRRGDWTTAGAGFAAQVGRTEDPGMLRVYAEPHHARLLARRGEPGAKALVQAAWQRACGQRSMPGLGFAATAFMEWAWLQDRPDLAEDLLEQWTHYAGGRPGIEPVTAELLRYAARAGLPVKADPSLPQPWLAGIRGDWATAADGWKEASDPYERALELAASGEVDQTMEALSVLDDLGATEVARRARRRLKGLGVRTVPRGPVAATRAHPAGLTARQADVLDLVAAGLTNAEIADRLVVSVRTVDHHVSTILGKLGVSSRREAGRLALTYA